MDSITYRTEDVDCTILKAYVVVRDDGVLVIGKDVECALATEDQLTFAKDATFLILGTGGIIATVTEGVGVAVLRLDGTLLPTLTVDYGAIGIA